MHQPALELLNKKLIILADDNLDRQTLLKNVVSLIILFLYLFTRILFITFNMMI